MTNCAKSSKNGSALKKPQKINVWNALLEKKLDFWLLFGPLWVPGCLPRRPGSVPESFDFFIDFRLGLKTGLDWRPGGPRELPGVPQAPPGHHFRWIFNRFFVSISTHTLSELLSIGSEMRDETLQEILRNLLGGCQEIASDCDAVCLLMLDLSACPSHGGQTLKDLTRIWCDNA